jgi:alpha-glucoside transport system permease protein
MAVTAKPRDSVDEGISRFLVPVGAVLGLVLIVVGVIVMKDPLAGQHLLANIYDLLGNTSGAAALRNGQGDVLAAKILLAVVAIVIGVGGIWMVYTGISALVGLLHPRLQSRILPWVFVVPAMLLLIVYLVYPTIATFIASFTDNLNAGDPLTHYKALLSGDYPSLFRNNLVWLVVGTAGSVGLGLIIAGLVDRVRREALAKTFIFLPLAISLVGASVIWDFVYAWRPEGSSQIGLLNAVWTGLGLDPVPWTTSTGFPVNTLALIVIFIWLQTGFAMVVLSAAIKGVSVEVLEAARLDGASERQIFFGIVVPIIKGSIITVATTIAIAVLKIFDIVFVMTGGRNDTDVVAARMFNEMFTYFNDGRAAALAVVLFIAVTPIIFINVRNLNKQGIGA